MATTKKPVPKAPVKPAKKAAPVTSTRTATKAAKEALAKPKAKPPVKSVIKTESAVKTAVKAVKGAVKTAAAKVVPTPVETKQPVKRTQRVAPAAKAKPATVKELPKETEVKTPWDSVEGEKLQATLPPTERLFPLVPLMIPDRGAEVFSHVFEHKLNVNGEIHVVNTGYLSVNRSLDLLALTQSDEMINKGFVNQSDVLHKKMKLASLHIQINGKNKFIDCTSIVHEAVEHGDFRTLRLELTVVVNHEGKNYAISIEGNINLEIGNCYLSARSHPDVEVKGYFLDGARCTYNRQAA